MPKVTYRHPIEAWIGPALRALRHETGHTIAACAKRGNIAATKWSDVERGQRHGYTISTLARCCDGLGVPLARLMEHAELMRKTSETNN